MTESYHRFLLAYMTVIAVVMAVGIAYGRTVVTI